MNQVKPSKPKPLALYILLALIMFLASAALCGGGAFIIQPDGSWLNMPVSFLRFSPFHNYLIPGIVLFLSLGVLPMLTFTLLLAEPEVKALNFLNIYADKYVGWTLSLYSGLALTIWMVAQIAWMGFIHPIQIYFTFWGVIIIVFTLMPGVMKYYSR